jgi:hypothetical protein
MYVVRDDNRTLFELGKTRGGLHVPLEELADIRKKTFVLAKGDDDVLGEFLLDGILDHGYWEQPHDYRPYAFRLAKRLIQWADEQPVRVVSEHDELTYRTKDPYITTDSRYEHEWPYYDVFQTLDRTLQEQIDTHMPPPSTLPAVLKVRKYQIHEFSRLKDKAVYRNGPDGGVWNEKIPVEEHKAKFLEEMKALKPYAQNDQCGVWGCEAHSPHDHGPRDTGPKELRFCGCVCHDGEPIFCSCWSPCCHQPKTPRAEQTPRPPVSSNVKLGDFDSFTFPVIRNKPFPKLFPEDK